MEITAALAADLAVLSESLDGTGADIRGGLRQLATDARLAVPSYLGLTVVASVAASPWTFTVLEDSAGPVEVASSLTMPLSDEGVNGSGTRLAVILYADRPGAFVDLAADLCWLTGRPLSEFALDQNLQLPAEPGTDDGVHARSVVNQAIGVLLAHGFTPEQAELEIDARAAAAGHSRFEAAETILNLPPPDHVDPAQEPR